MRQILFGTVASAVALFAADASADYVIRDGNNVPQTVKSFTCTSKICPQATLADQNGVSVIAPVNSPTPSAVTVQSNPSAPLAVSGTFSASLSGFAPNGNYASLSAGTSSGNVALPNGVVVLVQNLDASNTAYINLGTSNSVTATTSQQAIPAGQSVPITVGSNTYLAAITASSTASLRLVGGSGLFTGVGGGGSGGGGGGGAVTLASGAVSAGAYSAGAFISGSVLSGAFAAGSIVDLGTGGSPAANTVNARLATLNTTLGSPFQAGGSIGNTAFGISGTLPAFAATPAFNLSQLDGSALGAPSNYGTSPGAVAVQGVNAFVTGGSVTANLGTLNGAATAANQTNVQSAAGTPNSTAQTIQGNASGIPIPVTGTISASIGGFAPGGQFATLTASNTSGSVALPTGTNIAFQNLGTTAVSCTLGIGSATASASQNIVPAGGTIFLTVGSNTFGACIDQTGSASNVVALSGGAGLGTSLSAGSTGGGGTVSQGSAASLSGAWPVKPTDGTTAITVKAASTAPVSTDTAQVVTQRPDGTTIAGASVGTAGSAASNVVTVQGIASMTALKVDGSGVTQPVSAASLPLPTNAAQETGGNLAVLAGAVTSSVEQANLKQVNGVTTLAGAGASGTGAQRVTVSQDTTTIAGAAPGTAGTPSANVLSVQGESSMTALKVDGSAVTQPISAASLPLPTGAATSANQPTNAAQGSTTSAQTGTLIQGAVTTSAPSYTTAQTSPLSLDTAGNLRVNVVTGGGSGGTSSTFGAAYPTVGTAIGAKNGANMVNLAADASNNLDVNLQTALPAGTNLIGKAGIDQTTIGTTNGISIVAVNAATALAGAGAVGTGAQRVAVGQDTTTIAGSAPGTAGTPSANVLSVQGASSMTPLLATPSPATTGGLSAFFLQPAASDNHTVVKNGAGQVYEIIATNNSATINYLRFFNLGTGFNGCGSATGFVNQIAIPASTSGAGFVVPMDMGLAFSTGISICVTSGYSQTDTTNATASAMSITIGYK